jgi:putative transposase
MKVCRSGFYAWLKRRCKVITEAELNLYRRSKKLFHDSRQSLGSRQLMKQLRKEGFMIGRYKVRSLMKMLNLRVKQRVTYKVTTKPKHSDKVADNVLNQQFNPAKPNHGWAGDVTYLKTGEGWMYLSVVMDLYSRKIIGWAIDKRMTVDLVERSMQMAITLRKPEGSVIFHSDRGSQYTSSCFQKLLGRNNFIPSMSGKGACLDNAVVERFFGSLKNEWLLNMYHLTSGGMKKDVEDYIRYYNGIRLHTTLNDLSPIEFEESKGKVSSFS